MSTNYVVVYTANGQLDAMMIKALLESNGIQVFVAGESAGTSFGITMGPMADVDILVPSSQAEEAKGILDSMEKGDLEAPDQPEER